MELSNFLRSHQKSKGVSVQMLDSIRMLLVMLYPIAPHLASELWSGLQPLPSTLGKANVREINVGHFPRPIQGTILSRTADDVIPNC
jgi:leucyl-tRNA synthetase